MITDIKKTIREYLPNILHMSLATCADNKPWVCEVHFVYDESLNLYFRSKSTTRHCQEIAKNPQVAGNIVVQHGLTEKPRGVYFEGKAELLEDGEAIMKVLPLFIQRIGASKDAAEEAKTEDGHKFYKITVSKYYLFDSRESKPSRKYELKWESENEK